jgi:hypothetical protein
LTKEELDAIELENEDDDREDDIRISKVKDKLRSIDNKGIIKLPSGIIVIKNITYNETTQQIEFEFELGAGLEENVKKDLEREFLNFIKKIVKNKS